MFKKKDEVQKETTPLLVVLTHGIQRTGSDKIILQVL